MREVQARWSYSEILSKGVGHFYDGLPGVEALRKKARAHVRFHDLTEEDFKVLCRGFNGVRGAFSANYLRGIAGFHVADWSKEQLSDLLIVPNATPLNRFAPFSVYAALPIDDTTPPCDARRAAESVQMTASAAEVHPVTLGMYAGRLVLLDGYHRAIRFWHSSNTGARLATFVPIPINT